MKPDHTDKIRNLPAELLLALKARALDPDTTADTEPFAKNTSTKKGTDKQTVTICRRGEAPAYKRDQFGSPATILAIIDRLKLGVESDPPGPLPPPTDPTPTPSPLAPESDPLPRILPVPSHADTSWRRPVFFAMLAALATVIMYVHGPKKAVTDIIAPTAKIGKLAPDLPLSAASSTSLASTAVAFPSVVTASSFSSSRGSAGLLDTTHSSSRQTRNRSPASTVASSISLPGKLAEVFAAISAQHDRRQATSGAVANPGEDMLIAGNLEEVAAILETHPRSGPIMPCSSARTGVESIWPESALITTVRKNLRAVSYKDGVLVLWVNNPITLSKAFAAKSGVIIGMDGWRGGAWDYTVRNNRIEIREVVGQ
jgi:hypothetical protein